MVQKDWNVRAEALLTQPIHNLLPMWSIIRKTLGIRSYIENFLPYHHQASARTLEDQLILICVCRRLYSLILEYEVHVLSHRACLHRLDLLVCNSQTGEEVGSPIICHHTRLLTEQAKFTKWKLLKGTVLALRADENRYNSTTRCIFAKRLELMADD